MTTRATALAATLHERFADLPPKQQAVARVLLADPAFVSFASAGDVAQRAGADAATVVRTCQNLGYHGWRELQEHVRDTFAGRRTFAERVETLQTSAEEDDLVGRVFAAAVDNVSDTLDDLDGDALEAAADAIVAAPLTVVTAGGVSQGAGQFLTSSLQILGYRSVNVTGAADAGTVLGPLRRGDVVVAISVWRYLRATVQLLELARLEQVVTVAVTDSMVAPAALLADHTLLAHTRTAGPRLGMAGIITLLEALIAIVAARDPDRATDATARANRLYFDGNVLGTEGDGP